MLIRNAEIGAERGRRGVGDVRIDGAIVSGIGRLRPWPGEPVVDARGGALLPGLHDHHIHLAALATRASSVWCGPPDVADAQALSDRLSQAGGSGWIRAIGYHESVLGGLPAASELDRYVADRPLRLQHRSGRMWLLNSMALKTLLDGADPPHGLERDGHGFTGRLFDEDTWLRRALGGVPPDFSSISADLAACGVTGLTDMTPHNDPGMARHFAAQIAGAALKQNCAVAGTLALADAAPDGWTLGPAKLHLHEAALPEFGETVAFVRSAHGQGRNVAVHCVSEVELVFALAALEEAGASCGDRIEHASVASLELVERIAALGLAVCVQSHFVFERGDRYLAEVEPRHHPDLYRLRTLIDHGVPLAGGSDAPFGEADPWAAMRAATKRRTAVGQVMGPMEALTPEQALALYLASPHDLVQQRKVEAGAAADLVLLDRPWSQARERLVREDVALTIVAGRVVHDRVDQPPVQRLPGVETPA